MEKEKKTNSKELQKEAQSKSDKRLYWILGSLAGLVVVFLAASSFFSSLGSIEYEGLTFTKEKFGDIPLFKYYFYANPTSSITGQVIGQPRLVTVFLRNDPRQNEVPVEGEIEFPRKVMYAESEDPIYLAINSTGLTECEDTTIALAGLASFLSQSGMQIEGAVVDEEEALEGNVPYVTCESRPDDAVIIFQAGSETKIVNEDENCHTITVANCEALDATEKFIVQSLLDARARAGLS